jgi:hypothetical protein
MKKTLEDHPIWDELEYVLKQIDMENLAMQHLESCHYKLSGYWTEDEFYIAADIVVYEAEGCEERSNQPLSEANRRR